MKRGLKTLLPWMAPLYYRSLHRATPAGLQRIRIQGGPLAGRWFTCSLRAERPYFVGNWEPEVVVVLRDRLRPSDTFLDVGGHVGYMALVAATLVGARGRVVTFEANGDNAEVIARNLADNPDLAATVTLEPTAVWDSTGTATFSGESGATTGRVVDGDHGVSTTVRTTTLDDYVRQHDLRPSLIKMDIEGGESRALPGMMDVLRSKRPVLLVEVHDEGAFDVLNRIMNAAAYRVKPLERPADKAPERWQGRAQYLAEPVEQSPAAEESLT
jgi:FkbM family methyltransferase